MQQIQREKEMRPRALEEKLDHGDVSRYI
jgi:hypothetical protein